MIRVIVIDDRESVAEALVDLLRGSPVVDFCRRAAPQQEDGYGGHLSGGYASLLKEQDVDAVVYSPPACARHRMTPDLEAAEAVFQQCVRAGVKKFILLSSGMIY